MGHIVLIGPIGVGKSTVAPFVASKLGRRSIEVDELRGDFFATLGYDQAKADEIVERDGVPALITYWKPFEIELVEYAVTLEPDAVLDFGAGHSHFEDESYLRRAVDALTSHYVVLLMPSEDVGESERMLGARQPEEYRESIFELNATFLRSRPNSILANRILYTSNRSPEVIAEDVVRGWVEAGQG